MAMDMYTVSTVCTTSINRKYIGKYVYIHFLEAVSTLIVFKFSYIERGRSEPPEHKQGPAHQFHQEHGGMFVRRS